jgi:glucosamine--fructose-6-phosphate aminotransferase (isomerizing)
VQRLAVAGRVAKLRQITKITDGSTGIGHTRWATHGAPDEHNAHPIAVGQVALAHNGIIENHAELRRELTDAGRVFHTDTDSEVAAHLLDMALADGDDFLTAMRRTAAKLHGAYALVAVAAGNNSIAFARDGSPLMAGTDNKNGFFVASDAQALNGIAHRALYVEDRHCGLISTAGITLVTTDGETAAQNWQPLPSGSETVLLGEHRHFMEKEIFEQPDAIAAALQHHLPKHQLSLRHFGNGATSLFKRTRQVVIIACGTSYHAALIATYWLRNFGIPCRAAIASEYRYCPDKLAAGVLAVGVSQSGETADTLSAMRTAKSAGATTVALVNVPHSAMAREADLLMLACAGTEIGVAATKSFTAQLTQLLILTLALTKARNVLAPAQEEDTLMQLRQLPYLMRRALLIEDDIRRWARVFAGADSALFIGRHTHYPLALEGALKLKEISYIHAEGCAAGELKHGTLALVDKRVPIVGLAPDNELLPKITSNLAEVAARDGRLFVLAGEKFDMPATDTLRLQDGGNFLSPLIYAVPLQLLAYHTALQKGTDIDKPRNLAKSVTVE